MSGTPGAATPVLPRVADNAVADLVERMRPRLGRPVDALQVAAALESDGLTDRSARDEYGHGDVFELAEDVFRRLRPDPEPPAMSRPASGDRRRAARDISHGLLYLMPGALLPPVLGILDVRSVVLALLTAGALGWVWSGGTAWLGYRLMGRGLVRSATGLLRWSALLGPAVAAGLTAVLGTWFGGGLPGVLLASGLLAYQVAVTGALFYRYEGWLLVTMAPAAVAGVGYVATGRPAAPLAVGVGVGSVALAFALAVWRTTRPQLPAGLRGSPGPSAEPPLRHAARPELPQLCAVLLYAALSAGYLLHADGRHLSGPFDLAVAAAPLIVGMGLVEWRARRFHERARALLRQVRCPRRFSIRLWLRLAVELVLVTTTVAVLAAPLLVALRQAGLLTTAGTVLVAAHVAVAGAYFVAFILAGHGRYGRLSVALGAALAAHLTVVLLVPGGSRPLVDAAGFLGSAVLLQAMLLAALTRVLGQAWRYR